MIKSFFVLQDNYKCQLVMLNLVLLFLYERGIDDLYNVYVFFDYVNR